MKKFSLVAQYLLAVMLIVFGLNKFMLFLPAFELSGFASKYMEVVAGSYIMTTIGVIYLVCAVLLIFNRAVGLATMLLAPIAFNAFMFHLTLDIGNIAAAAVFLLLLVIVMFGNAPRYKELFT